MRNRKFVKTFFIFLLIGFIGILSYVPSLIPSLKKQLETVPNAPDLPLSVLVPLSLINPFILVIIAIVIGMLTAPKVELKSYIYDWIHHQKTGQNTTSFKSNIGLGVISGVILAMFFVGLEILLQPYLPDVFKLTPEARNLSMTFGGIFYGGITEELMLRWGMMSFIVWSFWKLFQRSQPRPSSAIYWVSIILSALLFAVGHYGATAMAAPVTTILWIRMMILNGLGAIVFGWLFWKKGLEISFISHASLHIASTIFVQVWFLIF
ncbi:CPBP family glutamic-type intramembrane protease [Niallia endozanthoxylica]|uniref:CPBP family intramembrane metalloprotease n=1 Tax=Niallia endozanthoxylica TaxID=2036016 RepID=A0A5J5H1R3_9BACI|nr:CPBP family glutamic-type intramembrane protease [Niallia endozanthoxylica]KAA9013564.1 CPBP family intramembrane metalloprotease [Niallia endozanthoxylica]